MDINVDDKSKVPAYLQLYNELRSGIVRGAYAYNSKLPSKRTISLNAGVSLITVEHAINLLQEEGYVEAKERSGYFVIYKEKDFQSVSPDAGLMAFPKINKDTTDGAGFPFSVLSKTMRKVLLCYGDAILNRSPNEGMDELRSAIKNYLLRSRDISVDIEQIVVGAGAEYLYGIITKLIGRDLIYGLEDPAYDKIRKVYDGDGVNYDLLTLSREGITTDSLNRTNASVLHVTPFNSFPTGVTIGINKKREYLNFVKRKSGFIIEDNYDSELTVSSKPEEPLFSMTTEDNVFYLNTFSKTIAPSLRIGYLLLPKKMVSVYRERLGFYSCTVPVFEQLVLAELIENGDFERHINRVRRNKRKNL